MSEKNVGGRPKARIDQKKFEAKLRGQCTLLEVAGYFDVSKSTIQRWCKETYGRSFDEVSLQFRQAGLSTLRSGMFAAAAKSPALMIFLAKNYLGMSDDPQPADTGEARKEFTAAIKAATKALESCDLSRIADIPEPEGGSDGESCTEA